MYGVVRNHPVQPQPVHMAPSRDRYRLIVAGHIAQTAAATIEDRFGIAATIHALGNDTAVDVTADQPSLRALAILLWDLGHDLLAILRCGDLTRPD